MLMKRLAIFLIILGISRGLYAEEGRRFQVIVNSQNPVNELTQNEISSLFLKKNRFWENGELVLPADLSQGSNTRNQFSEAVLNRSVSAVRNYWQQMIFSGRDIPPPEFSTDEEIIQYVMSRKNAIGYISQKARTDRVKLISVVR